MTDVEIVGSGLTGSPPPSPWRVRACGCGCTSGCRMPVAARRPPSQSPRLPPRHMLRGASPRDRLAVLPRVRVVPTDRLRDPEISFAHPLPERRGGSGIAYRDLERTADALGRDGAAYRRLIGPLSDHAAEVARFTGSALLRVPPHPVVTARFGLRALAQGSAAWNAGFTGTSPRP